MDSVEYLKLKEEIRPYLKMLREASSTIIEQDVSEHPIFVFHKEYLELGVPLADSNSVSGSWSVRASTLEEFVARQLIGQDRVDSFKSAYKDPEEWFCLFIVQSEQDARFVFIPHELSGAN